MGVGLERGLLSEQAIHFVPAAECNLMDTIHLQCRPHGALAADICNWCQGPINHPVSKRPCNAFYISTYVESKRVCHRGKPLSRRKKLFWKLFPSLIWTICAIDWGGFYLPRRGYSQNEVRQTPSCPLQKWRIYACKPKSTWWITTNIKQDWQQTCLWGEKGKKNNIFCFYVLDVCV